MLKREMDEYPGYEKHKSKPAVNNRNGFSNKVPKTNIGDIPLGIPRDRESSFDPVIVYNVLQK
jgi:putative transposase